MSLREKMEAARQKELEEAQPVKKAVKRPRNPPAVKPERVSPSEEAGETALPPMRSQLPETVSPGPARDALLTLLSQCQILAEWKAGHPKGKLRPWQKKFRQNINKAERALGQPETKWDGGEGA